MARNIGIRVKDKRLVKAVEAESNMRPKLKRTPSPFDFDNDRKTEALKVTRISKNKNSTKNESLGAGGNNLCNQRFFSVQHLARIVISPSTRVLLKILARTGLTLSFDPSAGSFAFLREAQARARALARYEESLDRQEIHLDPFIGAGTRKKKEQKRIEVKGTVPKKETQTSLFPKNRILTTPTGNYVEPIPFEEANAKAKGQGRAKDKKKKSSPMWGSMHIKKPITEAVHGVLAFIAALLSSD